MLRLRRSSYTRARRRLEQPVKAAKGLPARLDDTGAIRCADCNRILGQVSERELSHNADELASQLSTFTAPLVRPDEKLRGYKLPRVLELTLDRRLYLLRGDSRSLRFGATERSKVHASRHKRRSQATRRTSGRLQKSLPFLPPRLPILGQAPASSKVHPVRLSWPSEQPLKVYCPTSCGRLNIVMPSALFPQIRSLFDAPHSAPDIE